MNLEVNPAPGETIETVGSSQIARAAGIISLGNVFSRVMGLVREVIKSNLFGAGGAVSAFNVAASVPIMISDLLVNGMVNSSLVPVFSEYLEEKSDELWQLAAALLNFLTVILLFFTILAELFSEQIARLINTGASPEMLVLTASMLKITIPAVIFLNLAAVFSGLLFAMKRFTLPAFMATAYNLTIIIVTLSLHRQLSITAMAFGLLSGSVAQLLLLLPGLKGTGARYSFRLWHPGLKKIVLLYLPIALGVSVDVLLSRPISYSLASRTGESGISWMNYATYLTQLPQGLVATAISFAILPTLSAQAVRARQSADHSSFLSTLSRGLNLVIFLIVPATVGLFLLATPVIRLIYEQGVFTSLDTQMTSLALRLYLLGLPFAAVDLLLVFAFYALQDTLTPSLIGVGTIIFYLAVAVLLLPHFGLFSLMIADSLKHLLHMIISLLLLRKRVGDHLRQELLQKLTKVLLSSVIMGFSVWASLALLGGLLPASLLGETLAVLIPALIGLLVFVLVSRITGIDEMSQLWRLFLQKLEN